MENSEIKVETIATFDNKTFMNLKKRGFLPECFLKKIKNILMVWDIDTNEFYMKFDILDNSFYDFNQCKPIGKDRVQLAHKKTWIQKINYPKFVSELQENINNKNITIYSTYIKNKIVANKAFYILIDLKKQKGFAFSN